MMGMPPNTLEEKEVILRLKRWFVEGANAVTERSWPQDAKRSYHVLQYGGYRLQELASDNTAATTHGMDDDLDDLCAQAPMSVV